METKKKQTVVLGASANPARYSYIALKRLAALKHPITAIGIKEGNLDGIAITKDHPVIDGTDTITLYLNAKNQKQYYDYILALKPKRIIFNPGAENPELSELAETNGIKTMEACTLVLLATGQY